MTRAEIKAKLREAQRDERDALARDACDAACKGD
jgi:hypothetical protein